MVNASTHVRISLISICWHLEEGTKSFPSRKVCDSCSTARRLTDNRSANSTNWPSVILLTNLAGIGACPGPTIEVLSGSGSEAENPRLGRLLTTLAVETTAEADEDGGEPSEMKPADKLLMVERGRFGMVQKHTNQQRVSKDDQTHKDVKGKTTGDD